MRVSVSASTACTMSAFNITIGRIIQHHNSALRMPSYISHYLNALHSISITLALLSLMQLFIVRRVCTSQGLTLSVLPPAS